MTLPQIYAQPTRENDRIISLLSAVLMRSLRDEFVSPIESRFPSSFESRTANDQNKPVALITLCDSVVTAPNLYLQKAIGKSRLFTLTIELNGTHEDARKLEEGVFHLLGTDVRLFFVTHKRAHQFLLEYLSKPENIGKQGRISGILSLFPKHAMMNSPVDVPSLLLTHSEKCNSLSKSPREIVVVVPFAGNANNGKEGLWVARTILKYVFAICLLSEQPTTSRL